MGRLISFIDYSGRKINGVTLGTPIETDGDPATFEWDDHRLPNGLIDEDENIVELPEVLDVDDEP
jgi:hypothetical protein